MRVIDAAFVRSVLSYDPATGDFIWIGKTGTATRLGSKAGRIDKLGYIGIGIKNRKYAAHRLAWLWMTGDWPSGQIDHIDRNRGNNCWTNLRDVSASVNCRNRAPYAFGYRREGTRGTAFHKKTGKWQAQLCMPHAAPKYLGLYKTEEEAAEAYRKAREWARLP